ncbi:hypothetical protein M2158_008591 [Streptomyces sp. SAI-144]|nr:hypothetical protein [Streptomyces sp. SAI-144]
MSTEATSRTGRTGPAPGALLLCRAAPDSVAPAARLLRERMLLTRAGGGLERPRSGWRAVAAR